MNTAALPLNSPEVSEPKPKREKPKMKRSVELKIKIKSLSCEARIIKHEEKKYSGMDKWGLQHHRKTIVRDAARRTHIAYSILRGKDPTLHMKRHYDYYTLEQDRKSVTQMITKYGDADAMTRLGKLSWSK